MGASVNAVDAGVDIRISEEEVARESTRARVGLAVVHAIALVDTAHPQHVVLLVPVNNDPIITDSKPIEG